MMKKSNILWAILMFVLVSCGGNDDSPGPGPGTGPIEGYANCAPNTSDQTIDVVTWNIQDFPKSGESTIDEVLRLIGDVDPDIIALQEIRSLGDFSTLIAGLEGWEGQVASFNGSNLRLGYLYKTSEIEVITPPNNLFATQNETNDNAFTAFRRPLHMKVRHKNNDLVIDLINVHLKCCDGSEDRRRAASVMLKDYIDNVLPSAWVIVLGDFNDDVNDPVDNVFQNFIDDVNNYRFATLPIAAGSSDNWSFPSIPSHIDQILISDEIFEHEINTDVIKADNCNFTYPGIVSDHRPVFISIQNF